jgi:hypothetical protein
MLVIRSEEEVALWYYRLSQDLKIQGYEEDAERITARLQWRRRAARATCSAICWRAPAG